MQLSNQTSRLFVISDIHGHEEGLVQLLHRADYKPRKDRLVMLGDYVDTDPATWRALDTVFALVMQGAVALPGNAERGLLNSPSAADGRLSSQLLVWLKLLPLYWVEEPYLFVHAGIRHGLPLERQSADDLTEIREAFWKRKPEGGRTVVFGHTPTFKLGAVPGEPWVAPGRLGIDCGAKHGHRLALIELQEGISYTCSTHPDRLYRDWRTERLPVSPPSARLSDR